MSMLRHVFGIDDRKKEEEELKPMPRVLRNNSNQVPHDKIGGILGRGSGLSPRDKVIGIFGNGSKGSYLNPHDKVNTLLGNRTSLKSKIKQQQGLSLLGDHDRDGAMNMLDSQPRNPKVKGHGFKVKTFLGNNKYTKKKFF